MQTAVYTDEWDRARGETNTAPDDREQRELSAPTVSAFRRESGPTVEGARVSPRTEPDASKLTIPLPYMVTLITLALGAAAGVWRIENKVSVITNSIEYERELDRQREKYLDQRFAALEAKIEAAGLRNAALSMSQELVKGKVR